MARVYNSELLRIYRNRNRFQNATLRSGLVTPGISVLRRMFKFKLHSF